MRCTSVVTRDWHPVLLQGLNRVPCHRFRPNIAASRWGGLYRCNPKVWSLISAIVDAAMCLA